MHRALRSPPCRGLTACPAGSSFGLLLDLDPRVGGSRAVGSRPRRYPSGAGPLVCPQSHLLVLLPLAHASPPDPEWIAGIYDEADLDDVVVAVASATGLVETSGLCAKPVDAATGRPHRPVLDAKTLSATLSILRVERRSPAPAQRSRDQQGVGTADPRGACGGRLMNAAHK